MVITPFAVSPTRRRSGAVSRLLPTFRLERRNRENLISGEAKGI
jgi:hypothetical protein